MGNRDSHQIVGQVYDQMLGKVCDQIFTCLLAISIVCSFTGTEKYGVRYYCDGEIQCTVLLGRN